MRFILCWWVCYFAYPSLSQSKMGNEWFVGLVVQKINFENTLYSKILGSIDSPKIIISGNANICNSNGNLIIATDGFKLFDSTGNYMDGGGQYINNDSISFEFGNSSSIINNSIILPKGNNQYYVFVATMSDAKCYKYYHTISIDSFDFDEIRYSIVDMNANNGMGKIILKNQLLLKVYEYPWLNKTNFTASRHGNGRDWWLLKPSARMRQVMHKILVTPDTIICYKTDMPTLFPTLAYDNVGQSCFSTDGSLYAECNNFGPHSIYNFDRCNGELTFKRLVDFAPFKDTFGSSIDNSNKWRGLCFSPNGRFVYTTDAFNVYQLDLWEANDTLAIKRVSKDTNSAPPPWNFFPQYSTMQITPTGVLYLGNWHGVDSVIKAIPYPDRLGDSCGFNFTYVKAYGNTNCPPNMPYYGLGALKGSPCDTLNTVIPPIEPQPNSIIIANAFSPNGDGLNDTWRILNSAYLEQVGIQVKEVMVYNRLGNKVFSANDMYFNWQGKGWANDTYYYFIRYQGKNGAMSIQKGNITLVR